MRVNWREMRAVLAALAANLGIAITKFIAFLLTGSASMLAESVHSVADTGNQVLLLVGRGRSDRPRSDEHPFGFGRERYFYAFVVAVMLFTVGAAFSIYDGVHKIITPEAIHDALIAFIVLAVVHGAGGVLAAHRHPRGEPGTRRPQLGHLHPADQVAGAARGPARGHRRPDRAGCSRSSGWGWPCCTGDGRWDGVGSLAIGLLLAAGRRHLGHGDEEPADRRVGQHRRAAADRRRARGRSGDRPGHPPADRPHRPGFRAGRRQGRGPRRRLRRPDQRGHRRRRGAASAPPSPSPRPSTWSRTSTVRPRPTRRTRPSASAQRSHAPRSPPDRQRPPKPANPENPAPAPPPTPNKLTLTRTEDRPGQTTRSDPPCLLTTRCDIGRGLAELELPGMR